MATPTITDTDTACGVFVNSDPNVGSDAQPGTRAAPFRTLARALQDVPPGLSIYLCDANGNPYDTTGIKIPPQISIFGGLTCDAMFSYQATKTSTIVGPVNEPVLVLTGAGKVFIQNVYVLAPNATGDGGSSVAVVADNANLNIVGSTFEAQTGSAGNQGGDGGFASPSDDGPWGNNGNGACTDDMSVPGAVSTQQFCAGVTTMPASVGGAGGNGSPPTANAGNGMAGTTGAMGMGGTGQPKTGAWSCGGPGNGKTGAGGMNGTGGDGATALGTVTAAGYAGAAGSKGTKGNPGQGGGGGGGALGPMDCGGATHAAGAGSSGGAGGAGGCGGNYGKGGHPGGAAIALISLNATIQFTASKLKAGTGGGGGSGGAGRDGGQGGQGGQGGNGACAGGAGGNGGTAGGGGGGGGGHSLCVAYVGTVPPVTMAMCSTSTAGGGGGSNGTVPGKNGAGGKKCAALDFGATPPATACTTVP